MALTKVTEKIITDNLSISGIASASNFKTGTTDVHSVGVTAGSLVVGSAVTSNSDGIDVTGIVTATSFVGSGANLTGIDATSIKHTDGDVKIQAINTGANVTGNLSVSGNLGIAGVLTYEDVTNVDSIGIITARSTVSIADSIVHLGDTDTSLRFPTNNEISFETAGNERLRITTDNVLIHTTNSTTSGTVNKNLVVGSTTNNHEVGLTLNVMEGTNNRRVKFFLDDDEGEFGVDSTASTGVAPFVVRSAGTERLRITSSGQVGIGTNTFIDGSTNFEVRGKTANTSAGGQNIHKYGSASSFHYGQYNSSGDASLNNQADANLLFATNNTERLRITSFGDVYSANSTYNTYDTAATSVETVTQNNENKSGVYWLNFNGEKFRAYVKPNWLQGRNWVLAAKYFDPQDMPSGSSLWTNDTYVNESDFNLYGGIMSKYRSWRYFSFNRLAMQMGNRIPPIMQFNSNQTLYGAFSGGRASNGGGVTANSTDPSMSGTTVTYHSFDCFAGPDFHDVNGSEDRLGSYGLNKWANNAANSTSASNHGSVAINNQHWDEVPVSSGPAYSAPANNDFAMSTNHGLDYRSLKGFRFTMEDSCNLSGLDSNGYAGAWIGCALDEGNSTQGSDSSNAGADSGFGIGGSAGNNARTWTSGYAEWGQGNYVVNCLPAYIWLSID